MASEYFTSSFTCGNHANSRAIGLQNYLLFITYSVLQAKIPAIGGKNTRNWWQKYPELQAEKLVSAGKKVCNCMQKTKTAGKNNCKQEYLQLQAKNTHKCKLSDCGKN